MKRNGMDLGEDKENLKEHNSTEKQVSPANAAATRFNADKTLRERANINMGSDHSIKDNPKSAEIIPDRGSDFKSESPCIRKQSALVENNDVKTASCSPNALTADNDENEAEHKRYVRHQKLSLSTSETSLTKNSKRASLSRTVSPAKPNLATDKISSNSEDCIRSFKDLRKRMYPHQKEGMKWLARLFGERKGGILGDDMGWVYFYKKSCFSFLMSLIKISLHGWWI